MSVVRIIPYLCSLNNTNDTVVDEILELFYARYGRANLDERLREFFGRDLKESAEEDIEMTLNEYLNAVSINTPTPRRLQQLIKKK